MLFIGNLVMTWVNIDLSSPDIILPSWNYDRHGIET